MRSGVDVGRGVFRGGRRRWCGGPLHEVPDHGGFARLAHVTHITDTTTATTVADGTTDATATDATAAAASATPASDAALCVHGGITAFRGVPLRHRQLLVLDNRQTLNLDSPRELWINEHIL